MKGYHHQMQEMIDLPALAFDVALRYDPPEAIAFRYGISEDVLNTLCRTPAFQDAVRVAEREITETGKEFKLRARKLSSVVLDELAAIALDGDASHADRIKAISELTRLAGYQAPEQASGNSFNVQINLGSTP